jgi:hypothetical protein
MGTEPQRVLQAHELPILPATRRRGDPRPGSNRAQRGMQGSPALENLLEGHDVGGMCAPQALADRVTRRGRCRNTHGAAPPMGQRLGPRRGWLAERNVGLVESAPVLPEADPVDGRLPLFVPAVLLHPVGATKQLFGAGDFALDRSLGRDRRLRLAAVGKDLRREGARVVPAVSELQWIKERLRRWFWLLRQQRGRPRTGGVCRRRLLAAGRREVAMGPRSHTEQGERDPGGTWERAMVESVCHVGTPCE